MKKMLKSKEFSILVIIAVIVAVISIGNPVFWRIDNIIDLFRSNSVLGILACGMLLVILTGGIDVSVGAVTSACTCFVGVFLINTSDNIFLSLLVGIMTGAIMGLLNGMLVAWLEIPPIVTTLGTMTIINGIVKYTTNGTWLTDIPQNFIDFGRIQFFNIKVEGVNKMIGIPIQVLFLIAVIVITWLILKFTMFGRSVYALGGSRLSAARIGFNTKKAEMLIYIYMGAIAGVAAFVHTSIYRQVDPNAFSGYEMLVIGAVIIGGTNILGGYGSVLGVVLGVVFMSVLNNGLILLRIPTFWHQIVIGFIIVFTMGLDAVNRTRIKKNRIKVEIEEIRQNEVTEI